MEDCVPKPVTHGGQQTHPPLPIILASVFLLLEFFVKNCWLPFRLPEVGGEAGMKMVVAIGENQPRNPFFVFDYGSPPACPSGIADLVHGTFGDVGAGGMTFWPPPLHVVRSRVLQEGIVETGEVQGLDQPQSFIGSLVSRTCRISPRWVESLNDSIGSDFSALSVGRGSATLLPHLTYLLLSLNYWSQEVYRRRGCR